MMKILGIIGSPRKLGNSEIMIKEISRQIETPHELYLVRLHDLNIKACTGCYRCIMLGTCIHHDDFDTFKNALVESDAVVVAAPTYCLGANASLRHCINRAFAFKKDIDALWGKPAIGIGISGISGKEGYTLLDIENFLSFIFTKNKKCCMVTGALPGEIFMTDKTKQIAKNLAAHLVSSGNTEEEEEEKKLTPNCSLCGGTTFRFHKDQRVMCMKCSNSGTFKMKDGKLIISIEKGKHSMFLSKEDIDDHFSWLMGMKDSFIKHKRQLKQITVDYLDEGIWLS